MKFKLTKLEKSWIMYDVGNSAFILLVSTILPIYFGAISESAGLKEVDYLAYWGYSASIATLIVALVGPVLGSVADHQGYKKKLFFTTMSIGVIGVSTLWLPGHWLGFLALFVIAKAGYSLSLIFNDSMLPDVTTPERMDAVSTHGYAWGYIGSCIPFLVSLVIVLFYETMGITLDTAMMLAFMLTGLWWLLCSLPILKNYKQVHYNNEVPKQVFRSSFKRLYGTFSRIKQQPKVLWFLVAFFFYIDGVYTIIEMATAYGSSLGLDTNGLLIALLVTQLVAFPSALTMMKVSKKTGASKMIKLSIVAYTGIALFAIQLDQQWEFWVLAVCVGLFQGGIQALSRSYFAQIIPPEHAGEYFGVYDIFGKGAAFLGTMLVGFGAQITGQQSVGVAVLSVMFILGFFFFRKADAIDIK